MKTYICTTDNSNWMNSLERSYLTITSPSSKSIDIKKSKMSSFTQIQCELVWRCIDMELVRNISFEVKLTIEEMKQLKIISK